MEKMKKIKINSTSSLLYVKETPDQRKERVKISGSSLTTKIVPNKKKKTTKQQRQINKKEIDKQI